MMGWDGMGWGLGAGFGWIFMILFWVLLIAGTVWLVLTLSGQTARRDASERTSGGDGALRILDERYARGEIDTEEYKTRRAAIGGGR